MTAAPIPLPADQTTEADRDHRMAEVAEWLDIVVSTAYAHAKRGELPYPVRRVGQQYRVLTQPFDRWLRGETPEPAAEPPRVRLTVEEAGRLQVLLASAGRWLRRFEQASPWLCGGQHDTGDLVAAAPDLQGRLPDGRFAAGPAELPELAVHPLPPCAASTLRLEVSQCL